MYALCMYYACIIHTYVCMYACMQLQIKFITHATLRSPECESQARNHKYIHDACMYSMNF